MISPDKPEPMRYSILGEDNSTDGEKLEKYTGDVGWNYLRPHYERGALYFVDAEVDMVEVGEAMAADEAEKVKGWLKAGDLVKIEALHALQWEESDTRFEAVVISPFVLCRPI
ncbi:MAG: DUF2288 domain-containing protein [Verrucomicrobiota bacterium JB023]|nr:DUF2288 domain-containing protein [Verrucomicrobiota bacterium JB023]